MTRSKRLPDKYRPLFLGLLLFFCYSAHGQTYNPSVCCTVSNKAYGAAQAVSTDGRSWFYDATNFVMRDYNGPTEVVSYLNLPKYRSGHFPIYVHNGGILQGNGVWLGGITLVYWFKDSTGNANLVRWYTDSTGVVGGPFYAVANNLSEGNAGLIKGNLALDFVNNTSDAQKNAASVSLTNHSINGSLNTLTNIPNSALVNNSLGLTINSAAGSDISVTTTPATLGSSLVANIPSANGSSRGALTSTDWNTFNNKQSTITLTIAGNSGPATFVSNVLNIPQYTAGVGCLNCNADSLKKLPVDTTLNRNGYALTFDSTNHKWILAPNGAGTGITGVFGDATAAGSGSVPITLSTVNGNVGTFGNASSVYQGTVNAKGLTTAATSVAIQIAESQVTNLISDLALKLSTSLISGDIFVGNGGNIATAVSPTGDWTITNAGVNLIGANKVSYSKIQAAAGQGLMGAASAGNFGLITLGVNQSMTGTVLNAIPSSPDSSIQFNHTGAFTGTNNFKMYDNAHMHLGINALPESSSQIHFGNLSPSNTIFHFESAHPGLKGWIFDIDTASNSNPVDTPNEVLSICYGCNGSGTDRMRIGMEANFRPFPGAGFTQFEFHIPELVTDSGILERPLSGLFRKDNGSGQWLSQVDAWNYNNSKNTYTYANLQEHEAGINPNIDTASGGGGSGSALISLAAMDSSTLTKIGGVDYNTTPSGGTFTTNVSHFGSEIDEIYNTGPIWKSTTSGVNNSGRNFILTVPDANTSGPIFWVGKGWGQDFQQAFEVQNNANTIFGPVNTSDNGGKVQIFGQTTINQGSPSASAALDIGGTTNGILIPRLTTTQQNAISSPASGLVIYNTDTLGLVDYNGSAWLKERTAGAPVSSVSNSDGTITISPTTGAVIASLALGHINTWGALQTFGTLTTTGTTKFAGLTSSGANDSLLTADPTTGQVKWKKGSFLVYTHSIFVPTTGGTVNLINNQYNIINPAGALLALTVNLPSSPANNDVVYIKFTQTISTVTYGNGTVVDGITAPTAGGLTVLTFDSGTTSWY